MVPISQLSDDELKALTGKTTTSAPSIQSLSDDELKAMASSAPVIDKSSPAPEESTFSKGVSAVTDPINAFGSGVRKGVTDVGADIGTFATELLEKVFPKAADKINKAGRSFSDALDSADRAGGVGEAQDKYPMINAVGKGTGYVGGVAAASRLVGPLAPAGFVGQSLAQGVLASALAGAGNRIIGGLTGAFVPAVVTKASANVANFFRGRALESQEIKDAVTAISKDAKSGLPIKEATDKAFATFKAATGSVSTVRPQKAIESFVETAGERLTPRQVQVLKDLNTGIKSSNTIEDLHNVRKVFTKDLDNIFLKGDDALYGTTREAFKSVKNTIESNLQMNARKMGVLDPYLEANRLYKQELESDLLKDAFKTATTGTGELSAKIFNKKLINLKADKERLLSPATKQTIIGIQKTIHEANTVLGLKAQGSGAIGTVINMVGALADNPVGLKLFNTLGRSDAARDTIKNTVKYLMQGIDAKFLKLNNPNPDMNEIQDTNNGN
jgi:hypothetical protein